MKKIFVFSMVGLMLAAAAATAAPAPKEKAAKAAKAEKADKPAPAKEKAAAKAQPSGPVTHVQLAELLVKALGLVRHLPVDNNTLYHRLAGLRTELILFMMAATEHEKVKKAISFYFTNLRRTSIALRGEDLKRLGVAPGPIYRDVLQAVLDAKLNGRLESYEDELAFARTQLEARGWRLDD